MSEQETATVTPEKAFTRASAGYELAGKKLLPFTAQRQGAASDMGLRFGLVDDADIFTITVQTLKEGKSEKQDLQFYNQMFKDVVFVLWLCSVPESRVLRSLRKTDEAKTDAFKWADDNGISITSTQYFEAAAVFFQMMQDIAVSTPVPVKASDDDDDDDENPNE